MPEDSPQESPFFDPGHTQEAMQSFQQVMRRFLEVQESVMLGLIDSEPEREAFEAAAYPAAEDGPEADKDDAAGRRAASASPINRYVLRATPLPPAIADGRLDPSGLVVIVDDGGGVAERLIELLSARGNRSFLIKVDPPITTDGSSFEKLVNQLHEAGRASALVDLSGLKTAPEIDSSAGNENLLRFFALAKALQPDLEASAADGAAVLGATAMGGAFGYEGDAAFPLAGAGIGGIVKTIAQEWPSVRAKAVDFEDDAAEVLAERLLAELLSADGIVEVGYRREGRRLTMLLEAANVRRGNGGLKLDRQSIILVTGGARGITAEVCVALAERYMPTLVLVGRTRLGSEPEEASTAGLASEREIKLALFESMRRAGNSPAPAQIEAAYRQLMGEREVRSNLDRISAAGAKVIYLTCDVRDAGAFGSLIDELYARFGRIDGVIHGAGVIEDRLIANKSLDSFRRVLETKTAGAAALAAKLRPESLQFIVFFSSVSGRFGNRGQVDYAAGNEVLNKLAQSLNRRWPGRVVAINWGPWDTKGMVSDEARRQFEERGVSAIPIDVGCRMLLEELDSEATDAAEVVIAGLGPAADQGQAQVRQASLTRHREMGNDVHGRGALPLLESHSEVVRSDKDSIEVRRTVALEHDLYLNDHVIDRLPVVPFAMALELMAEVAQAGWPELEVLEVRDIRALRGIVVDSGSVDLLVGARQNDQSASKAGRLSLDLEISSAANPRQPHYRSTVEMGERFDERAIDAADESHLAGAGPLAMSMTEAYRDWLFHGPLFEAIESVKAMGPNGARGFLRPSSPRDCLADMPDGQWLIDPIVIDAALQMQVLWVRQHWDMTILPSSIKSYRRYGTLAVSSGETLIRCELRIRPETRSPISHSDFAFFSAEGRLLGTLADLEATGSRALNRLPLLAHGAQL